MAAEPFAGTANLWLPYTQMKTAAPPLPVVAAEGVRIKLADGRELIDGVASWWSAVHGYRHPHIVEAVRRQAEELSHVMLGGLVSEPAAKLAGRLAKIAPGDLDHVFFAESGSVAVEIAMKMAVQYWKNRGEGARTRFLSFFGGYHGDTGMAMAVSDPEEGMHALFKGYAPRQVFAKLPRDEGLAAALDTALAEHRGELAAVIVEPLVQGAGGMLFHDAETLRRVRAAAEAHGVLMIADEIFTAFGRTGAMFACRHAGVVPDIMTLSKALTGGALPLSCTIASERVYQGFLADDPEKALMHGPTYSGNALGCAAANASLDLFEKEPRIKQAQKISEQMAKELAPCRKLKGVREVRVKGAIGVVELEKIDDLVGLRHALVEEGVWVRPFANVVYLTPPLVIAPGDLSKLTTAIRKVLA